MKVHMSLTSIWCYVRSYSTLIKNHDYSTDMYIGVCPESMATDS